MRSLNVALLSFTMLASSSQLATAGKKPVDEKKGDEKAELMSADTFAGLALRGIGPAMTSGRITDLAVDPANPARFFVAAASGGVWRTSNGGTTFTPLFDGEGSYSIGCVTVDPGNPHTVWVGSGENNSQRSVSFGDGVYRSLDGGVTWKNMGLKDSQHIGRIVVDPRDSSTVYVAAQGPLWNAGGDRGLFKTTDHGATWKKVLEISENTGVNEVHLDPRDPDLLYASAYQRRRHVWTLVNGGPESGLHKSTDAGATWHELTKGLPEVDLGRIGICISPAAPDTVYAIVEAADDKGGFFRSTDRGESWEKRSDHSAESAQYYNELVCDPRNVDRVYTLETFLQVTEDGGKTFAKVPGPYRHVDDHAMWIDPANTDHLLNGNDGGVYESFDRGATWDFMENLPVTQFYRVTVDSSTPFYFVYGGTQDNATLGGPTRTKSPAGITNEDWFVTVFGDGFKSQVDPSDPNLVYSQWQYGGLVRHDRPTGEIVDIRPQEPPGEEPYRWNWDSPLIISPHSPTRLYFAANRLFRSDDRGSSWQVISGDLSRQLDRNALPVMGKVWGPDAVAKNASTSFYGNCVALCESPKVAGLLYVGTDDGLVQVTEDDGASWRKVETFPSVPDRTYVSRLEASQHQADTVYAAFDNHKNGDFKPYLLRSTDRGRSWASIAGDLPEREIVYALVEDHVRPELLFAGTELGLYFTVDSGQHWVRLKGGMPTIAVRDLAIQKRENDLALASFGRGFFILDDYTPLRQVSREALERESILFPVKDALRYVETSRLALQLPKAFQGDTYFTAPNPPFGAVVTYYLKDKLMTAKERRHEAEKKAEKEGTTLPYPSIDQLRDEDLEEEPAVLLEVRDADGEVVRRISGSRDKGFHRVAWDLRLPASTPVSLEKKALDPWDTPPTGPLALPGEYTVTLAKRVDGTVTPLGEAQRFAVVPLELASLPAADRGELFAFYGKVARLQRAVRGALRSSDEMSTRVKHLRQAVLDTPAADVAILHDLDRISLELDDILVQLRGDSARAKRNEPTPPSIRDRVEGIVGSQWTSTSDPTQTQRDAYRFAGEAFTVQLERLRTLVDKRLVPIEQALEAAGAPWTPGRLPTWNPERSGGSLEGSGVGVSNPERSGGSLEGAGVGVSNPERSGGSLEGAGVGVSKLE